MKLSLNPDARPDRIGRHWTSAGGPIDQIASHGELVKLESEWRIATNENYVSHVRLAWGLVGHWVGSGSKGSANE